MKKISALFVTIMMLVVLGGCNNNDLPEKDNEKILVVTSIYPIADFAKIIGGEHIDVKLLVPAGVEAHDWEPTAKDMITMQSAKVFLYNGGGLEPWLEKVLPDLQEKNVITLETGKNLFVEMIDEDDHGHNHEGLDPHIWLNPLLAIKQVESIKEVLCEADPKYKDYYEKNAANLIEELRKLHEEYLQLSQNTKGKEFVTMHTAFGYLASEYGWNQIALMGLDPHSEPTPTQLAQIIKEVEQKGVKYVFVEPQKDPRLMQEVAKQTNTKVLFLDPLENPIDDNQTYLMGMKKNLDNLRKAFL